MVDEEPHRSVQLIRRIDSRIPSPLLSASVASQSVSSSTTSLGKLADLRAPLAQMPRPASGPGRSQTSSPAPPLGAGSRGWTSVVQQSRVHGTAERNPAAWLMGDGGGRGGAPVRNTQAQARPVAPTVTPIAAAPVSGTTLTAEDVNVPDDWEDEV